MQSIFYNFFVGNREIYQQNEIFPLNTVQQPKLIKYQQIFSVSMDQERGQQTPLFHQLTQKQVNTSTATNTCWNNKKLKRKEATRYRNTSELDIQPDRLRAMYYHSFLIPPPPEVAQKNATFLKNQIFQFKFRVNSVLRKVLSYNSTMIRQFPKTGFKRFLPEKQCQNFLFGLEAKINKKINFEIKTAQQFLNQGIFKLMDDSVTELRKIVCNFQNSIWRRYKEKINSIIESEEKEKQLSLCFSGLTIQNSDHFHNEKDESKQTRKKKKKQVVSFDKKSGTTIQSSSQQSSSQSSQSEQNIQGEKI